MSNNSSNWLIGIDPGLDGATVAVATRGTEFVFLKHSDVRRIDGYLSSVDYSIRMAGIVAAKGIDANRIVAIFSEYPSIRSGQAGAVAIGTNWGVIRSSWESDDMPITAIPASVWKDVMIPKSLNHLKKKASCVVCADMGYEVPLHAAKGRTFHDGIADAILIAVYGGRKAGLI
jgi:hypothetical protein